jgi:LPS sulfotransferase NodH
MYMSTKELQIWDLWIADVGATGISFARGRLDATDVMIVHAAPEKLNVEVRNSEGTVIARGEDLSRTSNSPMCTSK